jgi:hypothetical protein
VDGGTEFSRRTVKRLGWTRAKRLEYRPRWRAGIDLNLADLSREIVMGGRWVWALSGWLACSGPLAVAGDDFAIKTQVYSGEEPQPVAEYLTIFRGDRIYDFSQTRPREVSVLDTKTRQFQLARPESRVQTSLPADELIRFAATEQTRALQSDNELVRFAADPQFRESFDAAAERLSLTSPLWDYHVETQPIDDRELLRRYSEFAVWYTYLNTLFRPLPPAVRIELNRALDRHARLPRRVVVEIKRNAQTVVRQQSRHELITRLGPDEIQQIDDWERSQASFRTVDLSTYRTTAP